MKVKNLGSSLIYSLLLMACATTITPIRGSEDVRVGKNDPAQKCKDLGTVTAGATSVSSSGSLDEGQRIEMKNQTFNKGGNYLRLDTIESGTAFRCP